MFLITVFVELRVVAGKSRTRICSPQAVCRRPCCAVALGRRAWSEHGMGAAWAWHGKCESDTAALVNQTGQTHSRPLALRHGRGTAWARHALCESAFNVVQYLLTSSFSSFPYSYWSSHNLQSSFL